MKKAVSVLLVLIIALSPVMVSATPFDYFGKQINVNTIGVKPAKFTNVEYKIREDVIRVNSEKLLPMIKSEEQIRGGLTETELTPGEIISDTGYIKDSQLRMVNKDYKIGTVLVDEKSQTAVKISSLSSDIADAEEFTGYVAIEKPEVYEIVEDFKIPKQTVELNQANIAAYGSGMKECIVSRNGAQTYAMAGNTVTDIYSGSALNDLRAKHLKDPFIEFKFDNESFTAYTKSGGEVNVSLSGYLGIDSMSIDGEYSGFKGYEFYLKTGEEMYLKAVIASNINEEVVIPVLGIDVNAEIARVYGGLFLVIGLNGQFTLVTEARQWLMIEKAGIRGGTFCYVPTSFKPLFRLGDNGFDVDASFNGAINGYIKAGPMLGLEIFGWEAAGAGALFGGGASCAVMDGYIEADIYGIANIYATLLGRRKNLLNWQPVIFHKRQPDLEGYIVSFKEACAYRKIVWGKIEMDLGNDGTKPYEGCFDLVIKDSSGSEKRRYQNWSTDEFGDFCIRGMDVTLNKNDKIYVDIESRFTAGKIISSVPVSPTFPFRSVVIDEADYFNDYVKGHVPTLIVRDWSEDTNVALNYSGDVLVYVNQGKGVVLPQKVKTDAYGNFVLNSNVLPKSTILARIQFEDFDIIDSNKDIKPTVDITGKRVVIPTEIKNYVEDGKSVYARKDRETYIVYNLRGEKTVTGDAKYLAEYKKYEPLSFVYEYYTGLPLRPPVIVGNKEGKVVLNEFKEESDRENNLKPVKIISLLDKPGGASFAVNDFNMEWVWGTPELPKIEAPGIPDVLDIIGQPADTRESTRIRLPLVPINPSTTINPIITRPSGGQETDTGTATLNTGIIKDGNIIKLPDNLNEIFGDKNQPQNTFNFRYYSGSDYGEDVSNSPTPDTMDVGWLRRKGELEYNYEGETIVIKSPEVSDKIGKGHKKPINTPANPLDQYMARKMWAVINPMPDEASGINRISNISSIPTWSKNAVQNALEKGTMDLGKGNTFKSGNITRGECAAYIAQAYGLEAKMGKSRFMDVTYMNPYLPQINAAVEAGLISGYSDNKFGTYDSVTREQMACIIMRGLKSRYGNRLSIGSKGISFKDMKNINTWAAESVNEISAMGIMKGSPDGNFNPKGKVTFNEVAVMLNNLDGYMQKNK